MLNLLKFSRWVERKGKTVTFGNVVGPYVGETYTYILPTQALAKAFEALAKSTEINDTGEKIPAAIPETWKPYKQK